MKLRDQVISVKGYAERRIRSDYGTWAASVSAQDADLATAYGKVETGRQRVLAFLGTKGFDPKSVKIEPANVEVLRVQCGEGDQGGGHSRFRAELSPLRGHDVGRVRLA